MSGIVTTRRSFLVGLGASLVAAPAIVRASSLMPVKALVFDEPTMISGRAIMARQLLGAQEFHSLLRSRLLAAKTYELEREIANFFASDASGRPLALRPPEELVRPRIEYLAHVMMP